MMVVTQCELGKFVSGGVLLHSGYPVNDTCGDEYGEISVQGTLGATALCRKQLAHGQWT